MLSTWLCEVGPLDPHGSWIREIRAPHNEEGSSWCAPRRWNRSISGSQRLQPPEDGRVRAPRRECGIHVAEGSRLRQRGTLHLEVDRGVAVCGLDTDVPEPMADRDDVYASLEEVNGARVAKYMGMHALAEEGRG